MTAKLKELHSVSRQWALTPLQHKTIVVFLGEPGE
ncbi:hypothetical protein [Bacteroides zhangwenhongii]